MYCTVATSKSSGNERTYVYPMSSKEAAIDYIKDVCAHFKTDCNMNMFISDDGQRARVCVYNKDNTKTEIDLVVGNLACTEEGCT